MGAAFIVVALVGLVLPISLILAAVLIDIVALVWAGYRLWHDEWSIQLGHYLGDHLVGPTSRYLKAYRMPR